jgi:hypothetical protein
MARCRWGQVLHPQKRRKPRKLGFPAKGGWRSQVENKGGEATPPMLLHYNFPLLLIDPTNRKLRKSLMDIDTL